MTKEYPAEQILVTAGEVCRSLQVVLKGSVRGEMLDASGKVLKIEDIKPGRPLAVAFLFGAKNYYPVSITTNEPTLMAVISRELVLDMMQQNVRFLVNYLNAVSNRAQFLSDKLSFLSFRSIKSKLANYFLSLEQKNDWVTLPVSHSVLANLFGVARPSLSRALREMHNERILEVNGKMVKIVDRQRLVNYLNE